MAHSKSNLSDAIHGRQNSFMRLVSKIPDQKAVFPRCRKLYVFTNDSHPNHSGLFGGSFWWITSTLTPAGASANWHERTEDEGRKNLHFWGNSTKLLGVSLHPGVVSICRNMQSLRPCLTWLQGAFLPYCFPEFRNTQHFQLFSNVFIGFVYAKTQSI